MQVTKYQLLKMLVDSYLESAKLHQEQAELCKKAALKTQEESLCLTLEEGNMLITIDEKLIPPSMLSQVAEALS